MADTNTAPGGDHDRVATLSINKDGSFDQNDPEIIGDKQAAIDFTKEQFAQRAVAAVDQDKRDELGLSGPAESGPSPDAAIDKLKAEHDAVAKSAESQAEAVVDALHKGDENAERERAAQEASREPGPDQPKPPAFAPQ